jgi:proteasome lid subunit RPN8/RPN11
VTIEAGVVLDLKGAPLYWHLPRDRTFGSLPDSKDLWEVFWENRDDLSGFAHSHPGSGTPWPSPTDISTFSAVELALAARLDWWITSSDGLVLVRWVGPAKYNYRVQIANEHKSWIQELRAHSDGVLKIESEGGTT